MSVAAFISSHSQMREGQSCFAVGTASTRDRSVCVSLHLALTHMFCLFLRVNFILSSGFSSRSESQPFGIPGFRRVLFQEKMSFPSALLFERPQERTQLATLGSGADPTGSSKRTAVPIQNVGLESGLGRTEECCPERGGVWR